MMEGGEFDEGSLVDLVGEVAVEEEGLDLEGLQLFELSNAEVGLRLLPNRPDLLPEVTLIKVIGFLHQILLLNECSDAEFFEFFLLVLLVLKSRHLATIEGGVEQHLILLHRHHVLIHLHCRGHLLRCCRLVQLYRLTSRF